MSLSQKAFCVLSGGISSLVDVIMCNRVLRFTFVLECSLEESSEVALLNAVGVIHTMEAKLLTHLFHGHRRIGLPEENGGA